MHKSQVVQRRRKKRSNGAAARTGTPRGSFLESFGISVVAGRTLDITVAELKNRNPNTNFRLRYVQATVSGFHATTNTTVPIGAQLFTVGGDGGYSNTSPLRLAGAGNSITIRVPNPLPEDWFPWNTASTAGVCSISSICLAKEEANTVFLRGVVTMRFDTQMEIQGPTCPTYLYLEQTSDVRHVGLPDNHLVPPHVYGEDRTWGRNSTQVMGADNANSWFVMGLLLLSGLAGVVIGWILH